jgi:nucleotide-binding universal stress UspA family protein
MNIKTFPLLNAKNAQGLTTNEKRVVTVAARLPAMKSLTVETRPATLRTSVTRRRTGRTEIAIKRILAPTDFSPASKKALKYAVRFARDYGSELTVLHVVEPAASSSFEEVPEAPAFSKAKMADAEGRLRTLVKSLPSTSVPGIRPAIRMGVAAHEIVEVAEQLNADLIVIATRGYEAWKHLVIGSTTARVARAAPCPVLVVRENEHDFV